jgi:hypothetical protein
MGKLLTRAFWVMGRVARSGSAMAREKVDGEATVSMPPQIALSKTTYRASPEDEAL